jgi:hypothetical protein
MQRAAEPLEKQRSPRRIGPQRPGAPVTARQPQDCQRPLGNLAGRSGLLRVGGHQFSRLVAACSPGGRGLGCQRDHSLAGEGLGEPV